MPERRHYEFEGVRPTIDEGAHVSREATLVGDVTIAEDASVWPGAVLRGDVEPVRIGPGSHVGDNATIHASSLGAQVMCGHGAVCNDAAVDDATLIGFNATLSTGVHVGKRCVVASGTVVPDGFDVPAHSFARGVPAAVTPIEETTIDPVTLLEEYSSGAYTDLAARHDECFE